MKGRLNTPSPDIVVLRTAVRMVGGTTRARSGLNEKRDKTPQTHKMSLGVFLARLCESSRSKSVMNSRSARPLSGANCLLRALGEQLRIDDATEGGANDWS